MITCSWCGSTAGLCEHSEIAALRARVKQLEAQLAEADKSLDELAYEMATLTPRLDKPSPKIRHVRVDDWYGLYIDGKLKIQGHSLEIYQLIDILKEVGINIDYEESFLEGEKEEEVMETGFMPEVLDEQ